MNLGFNPFKISILFTIRGRCGRCGRCVVYMDRSTKFCIVDFAVEFTMIPMSVYYIFFPLSYVFNVSFFGFSNINFSYGIDS